MDGISGSKTLHRLVYRSHFAILREDIDEAVTSILRVSIPNNLEMAITGLLLVHEDDCLQVLEGPAEAVLTTYGRICRDPRHTEAKVLSAGPAASREFAEWSMCARRLTAADNAIVKALSVNGAFDPERLNGAGALRLLKSVRGIKAREGLQAVG